MTPLIVAGSPAVAAFAQTLLHSSWQCVLIAATLWFVLRALPRADSSLRYAACCAALAAMPIASSVTFWWLLASPPPAMQAVAAAAAGSHFDVGLALSGAWALGCATMLARLALGVTHLGRLVKRAAPIEGPWQAHVDALALRLGLRGRVRLLGSREADAPLLIGWLKPVILVPLGALAALPPAYVEALLLHELGHARRLDYLVNLLQACVEALLFYHPAAHWVSACLRAEREHCCDDLAISMTGDRLGYARALEAMEIWRGPSRELAVAANGGSLHARIERIVRVEAPGRRGLPGALAAAGVLGIALTLTSIGAWSCAGSDAGSVGGAPAVTSRADESPLSAEGALAISWLPPAMDRWKPALAEAARQHGVSPELLAIVMLIESRGNPAAHSPGGAVGLMQIMPATAAEIAAERHLEDYSEARLWEPAYNLDFGAWYLAEQLDAFGAVGDRSVALAAVAYNGGPMRARAYLETENDAALYEEIRRYRDLVVGMWQERKLAESNTFAAWRERW
ncbi:MAG TPA: transglycosylase SLT domain-containing protein [Polyangiaceae bacterium]|nr:transglycosylase SLT domain-containing protein [Polyangiaceae bacterium]